MMPALVRPDLSTFDGFVRSPTSPMMPREAPASVVGFLTRRFGVAGRAEDAPYDGDGDVSGQHPVRGRATTNGSMPVDPSA
jgi:hypothetical protein